MRPGVPITAKIRKPHEQSATIRDTIAAPDYGAPHPRLSPDVATSTSFNASAQFIADEIERLKSGVRTLRVAPIVSSAEIKRRLEPYTFNAPVPLDEALTDVAAMLREWSLHPIHPRYFGLFVPGTHDAGVWADALTALYNPQVGAWWHSPAANEIELHTLKYLAEAIGFDAQSAHFTTGGSEANLTALLGAIAAAYPNAAQSGVGDASAQGVVYVSSQAHHSMDKAVRVAGLGQRVLTPVPCNERHEMDVEALRGLVRSDTAAGRRPLMIVGTFGTTTSGAIDDLGALATIARECGAWFHVDAAWGGTACFAHSIQHLLHGVREADSLTWDAHKWLSVPVGAGMFFCKHQNALQSFFDVNAAYVPKKLDEGDDLYMTTLQWSRRFIGLKVFLTLAVDGRDALADRLERQLAVAAYLRSRLTASQWRLANDSPLPIVCFTHSRLTTNDGATNVAREVAQRGRAWVSPATLPEGPVLRACITHDDTSREDVDVLCEELDGALERVLTI